MPRPQPTPSQELLDKEIQVLELRRAGYTFDQIAEQVELYDRGTAYRYYRKALARGHQQPAAEVRELEADRLDKLQTVAWAQAMKGSLRAIDSVLRISERRARLLGLDHADGIAERQLQLEQDKVRLVAVAFGRALDALPIDASQREAATRILLQELRAQAAGELPAPSSTQPPGDTDDPTHRPPDDAPPR